MSHIYIYYKYHIHSYPICKDCYRSLFQPPETTINDGWRKFLEVAARFVDAFNLIAINEAHEILTSQRTWWEWLISKVLTSLKAFRCFLEMIPALLCGEPVLLKMHQSQCKYDLSVSQPFHSKVSMAPESSVLNDWHLQFPLSLLPGSPPMTFRLSGGNAASSRLKSSNLRHLKNGTCLQMQACKTSRL